MNENFDSFNRLSVLLVSCLDRSKVLILVLERSDFKYLLSTKLRGLSLPGPVGGTRVSGLSDFILLLIVISLYVPAISVFRGGFGQGTTGPAFLLHVTCTGTESFLLSCGHWEIGRAYCLHSEDVGVVCQGKVMYCIGWGKVPLIFKWADATSIEWEGQWPREIDSKVTPNTSNLDHYKLFRAHCWLLLIQNCISKTS